MLKIGDFSSLSQVSIKALHHYDQIGLLKPVHVDQFTSYRYYSIEQLTQLNRILAFKDLGFSLEQIRILQDEQISPTEIRGMLRLRQAELQQHIEGEQTRLARVEARLRQIEQQGAVSDNVVVLKNVASQRIASAREIVPTADAMFQRCSKLSEEIEVLLTRSGIKALGPWCTIYHHPEYTEQNLDVEMAVIIDPSSLGKFVPQSNGKATIREMRAIPIMASVIHHGSYDTILQVYFALLAWIDTNGYSIAGPVRQFYLQRPEEGIPPVTELQIPLKKSL